MDRSDERELTAKEKRAREEGKRERAREAESLHQTAWEGSQKHEPERRRPEEQHGYRHQFASRFAAQRAKDAVAQFERTWSGSRGEQVHKPPNDATETPDQRTGVSCPILKEQLERRWPSCQQTFQDRDLRRHMAWYHSHITYCQRCFRVIHPPDNLRDHICSSSSGPAELQDNGISQADFDTKTYHHDTRLDPDGGSLTRPTPNLDDFEPVYARHQAKRDSKAPAALDAHGDSLAFASTLGLTANLGKLRMEGPGLGVRSTPQRFGPSSRTKQTPPPEWDMSKRRGQRLEYQYLLQRVARTKYTTDARISRQGVGRFASDFAAELFRRIQDSPFDTKRLHSVVNGLPRLLNHFATSIGFNAPSQAHRDVMFLVDRHRSQIAQHLSNLSQLSGLAPPNLHNTTSSDDQGLRQWIHDLEIFEAEASFPESPRNEEEETSLVASSHSLTAYEDEDELSHDLPLKLYQDTAFGSSAFEWLLSRVNRLIQHRSSARVLREISDTISAYLVRPHIISSKVLSQPHEVDFSVDLDLRRFLGEEVTDGDPLDALPRVITITGAGEDAQATTCEQYLVTTWPITGHHMMRHLKALLKGGDTSRLDTLADNTVIETVLSESRMRVSLRGTSAAILDVGEQLAWLSAALRASPFPHQLAYCTPYIEGGNYQGDLVFRIGFTLERFEQDLDVMNGQCWHQLFLEPVVVKGFPIVRKSQPQSGIEIPLRIMAALLGTGQTDEFNGKMFLKGFSKMAVPTKKVGETIYWHMYSGADGERISFLHPTVAHASGISLTDMEECRHVLGWTPNAEFHAGSPFANYDIRNSYLDSPSLGCAFSHLSVSQGSPVNGGPSFIICRKDANLLPVHIGRPQHQRRMTWIGKQMTLLWDNDQRTGWLINGVGALLHLVRASLHNDRADMFSTEMLLKPDQLREPDAWSPKSAGRFLVDPHNLAQEIFEGENETLRGRVDLFYNILEKLIEYQKLLAGDDGAGMRGTRRDILEGWDFNDIVMKSDDRIFARATTLDAAGKSWVDFARSLSAVTLFGRGYGQLIKPAHASICSQWKEIPPGRSYIAASMWDLRGLIHVNASPPVSRTYLGRQFVWHTESDLLEDCKCDDDDDDDQQHRSCEPVQSLLPRSMDRSLPAQTLAFRMTDSGALIFGQHSKSPFLWSNSGPPVIGGVTTTPTPMAEGVEPSHDSGIGSSMKSESTSDTTKSDSDDFDISQWCQNHNAYAIGIICALDRELKVVRSLLDETFIGPGAVHGDRNIYVFGRMGRHLVVCASLPSGNYGNNPAVMCAENMRRTFLDIQCCILVGVGGGIPSPSQDVRLGDLVVGQGVGEIPAVVQYDRGKEHDEGHFKRTGTLSDPPVQLLNAISSLRSDPRLPRGFLNGYVERIIDGASETDKAKYTYPGASLDLLHGSHERPTRPTSDPVVHYGPIASGNKVIRSAAFRDDLAKLGALCFDMEAAGVALSFPSKTLVVRGICDYSDAQKNKDWQDYAAANAAAYVKHLISLVPAVAYRGWASIHSRVGTLDGRTGPRSTE